MLLVFFLVLCIPAVLAAFGARAAARRAALLLAICWAAGVLLLWTQMPRETWQDGLLVALLPAIGLLALVEGVIWVRFGRTK